MRYMYHVQLSSHSHRFSSAFSAFIQLKCACTHTVQALTHTHRLRYKKKFFFSSFLPCNYPSACIMTLSYLLHIIYESPQRKQRIAFFYITETNFYSCNDHYFVRGKGIKSTGFFSSFLAIIYGILLEYVC